ncbi:MAG: hypothetical protein WB630_09275 [Candidatus Acidiferrales bacterium]
MNHPNICTIHEIDDQHGEAFIVMEFMDGLTLKHRIGGQAMEIELILSLAIEITVTLISENSEKNSEKPTGKAPAQPRKPRNLAAGADG